MAEVAKKPRKKPIPAALKRLVWNEYIGESIGKAKCTCCELTEITQMSFHCGHVIADAKGGAMTIDNLRPICQNCNLSMRKTDMKLFKELLKIGKKEHIPDAIDDKKLKEFESNYNNCIRVISMLKIASQLARPAEDRIAIKEFENGVTRTFYQTTGKKYIFKYEQIDTDLSTLESIFIPINAQIQSLKTNAELNELYGKFTAEKQNLIKLSEELKIRWKITEIFNL
jgi:hypothetical protein